MDSLRFARTSFPAWDPTVVAQRVLTPVMMSGGLSETFLPLKLHQIWTLSRNTSETSPQRTIKSLSPGSAGGVDRPLVTLSHSDTIAAGFVFYGRAPSTEDVPKISAPVYGFYGESDNRINATIDATKAAADAANVKYEPVIYEGVGHAFLRRGMGEEANDAQKTATKAAWERWVSLMQGL